MYNNQVLKKELSLIDSGIDSDCACNEYIILWNVVTIKTKSNPNNLFEVSFEYVDKNGKENVGTVVVSTSIKVDNLLKRGLQVKEIICFES